MQKIKRIEKLLAQQSIRFISQICYRITKNIHLNNSISVTNRQLKETNKDRGAKPILPAIVKKGQIMFSINNLADFLEIINELYLFLDTKINLDAEGWPIFQKEHFLNMWPEDIVTFANRKNRLIMERNKTVLCHFASDIQNYRRFPKIMDDIVEYQDFLGVVFPDITITKDMDSEMQKLALLANQLYAAVLAVNNIKLVANTRCGSKLTQKYLCHIPRNVIWASGFLGCHKASSPKETAEYINKILSIMPSKLIIYGKQDPAVNDQLDTLGINYRYYEDFHRRSKKEAV